MQVPDKSIYDNIKQKSDYNNMTFAMIWLNVFQLRISPTIYLSGFINYSLRLYMPG